MKTGKSGWLRCFAAVLSVAGAVNGVAATYNSYSIYSDYGPKNVYVTGGAGMGETFADLNITVPGGQVARVTLAYARLEHVNCLSRFTALVGTTEYTITQNSSMPLVLDLASSGKVRLGLLTQCSNSKYLSSYGAYGEVKVTVSYLIPNPGRIRVSSVRTVRAGNTLQLTLSRVGGSDGRIAVKYKSQTSTGICGEDFDYVKDIFTWGDGDTSSRTIYVPTHVRGSYGYPKMLRVKLSTLTTGAYAGYVRPTLEEEKIYAEITGVGNNPGTIVVSKTVSAGALQAVAISRPWFVHAGDTLRMTFSRVGGSDGSIAVKYKTQTSTGVLLQDYDYVKDILTWSDGDTSSRTIYVPTYYNSWQSYPLLLRVKLSTLATGAYAGNLVPKLEEAKIYVDLRR